VKHTPYEPGRALELLHLLSAIGREIEERTRALGRLEARIERLAGGPEAARARLLVAEAATQRRELRACRNELERLGCSVVGTSPLTIRIPTREGDSRKSLVWQSGDTEPH
jgi:hypothetical protein